jgi:hypothetical protein
MSKKKKQSPATPSAETIPNIVPPDAPQITPPDAPHITPPDAPTIDPPRAPGINPPDITPPDAPRIEPPQPPDINPPDAPRIEPLSQELPTEVIPVPILVDTADDDEAAEVAASAATKVEAKPAPLSPEELKKKQAEEAAAQRTEIIKGKVKRSGVVRMAANADKDASEHLDESFESVYDASSKVGSIVDQLASKLDVMDTTISKGLIGVEIERALREDTPARDKADETAPNEATTTSATTAAPTPARREPPVPEWRQAYRDLQDQKEADKRTLAEKKLQAEQAKRDRDAAYLNQKREQRANLEQRMQTQIDGDKDRLRREREAMDAQLKEERERKRAEREAYNAQRKQEEADKDAERRANRRLGKSDD